MCLYLETNAFTEIKEELSKGKKKVQGQPVPRSWKCTRFVGRIIQRDNFANITAGCLWYLNPPDLGIVDWLGDLHHTIRLQFKPRSLMPYLTYSAVVPFAPVYITWRPKFTGTWGPYQKPWYLLGSDTGDLWSAPESSVTFKDGLVWSKQDLAANSAIWIKFEQVLFEVALSRGVVFLAQLL